jgi:transposase
MGVKYIMSIKELTKSHVIQSAIEGKCTVAQAAERLGLGERRIKQLKKEYKLRGCQALIHGNAGKPSSKKTPVALSQQILRIRAQEIYGKSNFTHFMELLHSDFKIDVPYATLHRILTAAGIKSPKCRRKRKSGSHKTRARKLCEGMLLQADATSFDWLGDGCPLALHGFIDDATGKVTGLYLTETECLMGYLEVLRQTLTHYGIPQCLYPDRYSVFFLNPKKANDVSTEDQLAGVEKKPTQFGRIMDVLGIDMFPAHSPQAKGRIERLWETLQSRLPVDFARGHITTVEAANAFLQVYISQFNQQFAVEPSDSFSAYVPLPPHYDLDRLLCAEITRTLSNGSTVQIAGMVFRLEDCRLPPKSKVNILFSERFGIRAWAAGSYFSVTPLDKSSHPTANDASGSFPVAVQSLIKRFLLADAKAA